jgi:hypothetical protein
MASYDSGETYKAYAGHKFLSVPSIDSEQPASIDAPAIDVGEFLDKIGARHTPVDGAVIGEGCTTIEP